MPWILCPPISSGEDSEGPKNYLFCYLREIHWKSHLPCQRQKRICFSRANIPSLNSPQGFIGFAAPNQGGTIPEKWYTEKNGCMTLYDYMIPSLPAKKIFKIKILSKNEPTGTTHVSTTSLPRLLDLLDIPIQASGFRLETRPRMVYHI